MESLNMTFIQFATCANIRIVTSANISASTAAGGAGAGLGEAGAGLGGAGAGLGGADAGLAGKNTSSSAYEIQIQMCFIHVLHFIAHVTVTKTTKHTYIYTYLKKKLTAVRHGQVEDLSFHGQVDVFHICMLQEKKSHKKLEETYSKSEF